MSTNEEQACGACGEPASIHPVDGPNGVLKCGVENLTEEKRRIAAAFFEVARALLPDATSELEAVPIQDAVISMLGRIDGLRETAKGAERAAQRTAKANEEAAIEIRDRSLHLAAALCVASSTPWRELVAIAAASIVKRDQVIAQLEAQPFSAEQVIRLAYLLGCERVPIPAVGAKAIEVIEAALEGLGAKAGDSLLHAVARHRGRVEVKPNVRADAPKAELGAALGIDPAGHTWDWDSLLDRVRGLYRARHQHEPHPARSGMRG